MEKNSKLRLKWLGCAGFEMDFYGFTVVSDPFISASKKHAYTYEIIENCNLIALTHGHYDHITDIPALYQKFQVPVICGEQTAPELILWADLSPMDVYPLPAGQELDFNVLKIKALFGVHTKILQKWSDVEKSIQKSPYLSEHPEWIALHRVGCREYRNYLFTASDGTRILHWGNPLKPEFCNLIKSENPDVLLLQTSGGTPQEEPTIQLVRESGIQTVIANHIDFPGDYRERAENFRQLFAKELPNVRYIVPQYNKWIEL